VNLLLQSEEGKNLIDKYSHEVVVEAIRKSIEDFRQEQEQRIKEEELHLSEGQKLHRLEGQELHRFEGQELHRSKEQEGLTREKEKVQKCLLKRAGYILEEKFAPSLKRTINGTGTIIHTNLGRAKLSPTVKDALFDAAFSFSNLEYNLHEGCRGSRYQHLEEVLCELTGAEAALVVNNNAAAIMLVLDTLAKRKEVIVSRGELVEIGGSFRVPEIIELSGCKLKEVGTTNKTHRYDYERAIGEETGAILKVHSSNYKITGFTKSVPIEELSTISINNGELEKAQSEGHREEFTPCKEKGEGICDKSIPLIYDMGSGMIINLEKYGLPYEMTVRDSLDKGADVVTFSSDKVLGGPQGGIIVGKKKYIEAMKKNQLTRTLRVEKMTIATLEATLRLYYHEQQAVEAIPTLKMLVATGDELEKKAKNLAKQLAGVDEKLMVEVIDTYSQVGGGAYPGEEIKSKGVALSSQRRTANQLSEELRKASVPIISKIRNGRCELDVRTLEAYEFPEIAHTLAVIFEGDEP